MLSQKVNEILSFAVKEAQNRRHEYISVEHILFAILKDKEGMDIITFCGADIDNLKLRIENFFTDKITPIKTSQEYVLQQTLSFQRVLQRAIETLQKEKRQKLVICDLLIAIIYEKDSESQYFLLAEGVTKSDLEEYSEQHSSKEKEEALAKHLKQENYLKQYTTDLIEKASMDKIDNLIGREEEIERIIRILSRRRKNNPILIGEAGVGKTAIIEGLALKLHKKTLNIPFEIEDFYSLNLSTLLAGTKMRGDFEKRINRLLKILEEKKNAILFIDEIHTIVGAGATNSSSMDISNILKPILAEGRLRCIGATSFAEFKIFEKDRALNRRFEKIEIKEASIKESIKILEGLKHYYESHHKIKYSEGTLEAAATLSEKYINDSFLPDKAIDVIDETASYVNFHKETKKETAIINIKDIENIVAIMAKVPPKSVSASDKSLLSNLETNLSKKIFGQKKAIKVLTNAIKRSRAGLVNYERPVGSFLFSGPTGVGKTELAKQLALELGVKFVRFDMSEYMEKHSVARLIGSPPGYVGYEQGGLLTDKIRRNPYSIILFDEMEKAHFDIYNILLQIMDYGTLTDNKGVKANFKNAIIIMSSNIGAREMVKNDIGFMETEEKNLEITGKKATEKLFSPEFRNRIDENIVFSPLSIEVMEKIVDKFFSEIEHQGRQKNIDIKLTPKAKKWLAKKSTDIKYGARPLKRLIQTKIKDPLADYILFQNTSKNKKISIEIKKNNIFLNIHN